MQNITADVEHALSQGFQQAVYTGHLFVAGCVIHAWAAMPTDGKRQALVPSAHGVTGTRWLWHVCLQQSFLMPIAHCFQLWAGTGLGPCPLLGRALCSLLGRVLHPLTGEAQCLLMGGTWCLWALMGSVQPLCPLVGGTQCPRPLTGITPGLCTLLGSS